MVYFLERGERGLTKLDVMLGLEGSLGRPAGLPIGMLSIQHPSCLCWEGSHCGLRDIERTPRGWCDHLYLLAGSTALEQCSRGRASQDPAAVRLGKAVEPSVAAALAPTKAPLRASLRLGSASLAPGHPCSLRRGHSPAQSGGQSPVLALAAGAGREQGGLGGAGIAGGGGRETANKAPFCQEWCGMSNREAAQGKPLGEMNGKTETRWSQRNAATC